MLNYVHVFIFVCKKILIQMDSEGASDLFP